MANPIIAMLLQQALSGQKPTGTNDVVDMLMNIITGGDAGVHKGIAIGKVLDILPKVINATIDYKSQAQGQSPDEQAGAVPTEAEPEPQQGAPGPQGPPTGGMNPMLAMLAAARGQSPMGQQGPNPLQQLLAIKQAMAARQGGMA